MDYTCTHELLNQTFTSKLDNFFWSTTFSCSVIDAGVLHLPDNKSDHDPIYCVFESSLIQDNSPVPSSKSRRPRQSWRRSSSKERANYKSALEQKLINLTVPESVTGCNNVHCQDHGHREDLDNYTLEVLSTVQVVAEMCLSMPVSTKSSSTKKKIRPGWSDEVKPYRDNAYFWHQIWQSCGRPVNTEVHKIMKKNKKHFSLSVQKM